jgi:hypothetical protein
MLGHNISSVLLLFNLVSLGVCQVQILENFTYSIKGLSLMALFIKMLAIPLFRSSKYRSRDTYLFGGGLLYVLNISVFPFLLFNHLLRLILLHVHYPKWSISHCIETERIIQGNFYLDTFSLRNNNIVIPYEGPHKPGKRQRDKSTREKPRRPEDTFQNLNPLFLLLKKGPEKDQGMKRRNTFFH